MSELLYTEANTRVKNLRVKLLRRMPIGQQIEVEVLQSFATTYTEDFCGCQNVVIKEFHAGQRILVDSHRCKPAQ